VSVSVIDDELPTIVCPADVYKVTDDGVCYAIVGERATGYDNCPIPTVWLDEGLGPGARFPVGTTTNKFTVTDFNGNTGGINSLLSLLPSFDKHRM
jgi:hypothetical protein